MNSEEEEITEKDQKERLEMLCLWEAGNPGHSSLELGFAVCSLELGFVSVLHLELTCCIWSSLVVAFGESGLFLSYW